MKTGLRLTKYSLIALLTASMLLGAYVGLITYQYEVLVRGFLGLAVIYLIYHYGASSRTDGSLEALLSRPKFRHFLRAFLWSGLAYWAAKQVLDAILLLINN